LTDSICCPRGLELVEERRNGNRTERELVDTGRSHLVDLAALGEVGLRPDRKAFNAASGRGFRIVLASYPKVRLKGGSR